MPIEEFRDWKPRGQLKIRFCVDKTRGEYKRWICDADDLSHYITGVVNHFESQGFTLTNRQLYYQLVKACIIPNYNEIYKRICKFLTDMRYGGYLDWYAIEDRGRVPKRHAQWTSIGSLIDSAIESYRLPRWEDQDYYLELYCEKQAMEGILRPIADEYHIHFGFNKGYCSASTMYRLAQRVIQKIHDGKDVVILYLGDHDPSGLDMIRDIEARLHEFLTEGETFTDPSRLLVEQIALTKQQIKKFDPPPNPVKPSDTRTGRYFSEHGSTCWELDALDPHALQEIATRAIHQYLDMDKYNAVIDREIRETQSLVQFGLELETEEEE